MAFRFPLAVVLKYRAELEQREERALGKCRETVNVLRLRLQEARAGREHLRIQQEEWLKSGVLGSDIHYVETQLNWLEALEAQLERELAVAVAEFDEQMKLYLAARQKREILEELRKNQLKQYTMESERKEQARIDELFNTRFQREK